MKTLEYSENDRRNDFHFFAENHQALYEKYGKCFIAIRNGEILCHNSTPLEILNSLSAEYEPGTYSIQECNGLSTANHVRIQRMAIGV